MNRRLATVGALAAVAAGLIVATPTAALAGCASDRGYYFNVTKNYGKVLDGTGVLYTYKNAGPTTTTVTASSTTTKATAVAWSVNASVSGSAGFDFKIIKLGVEDSVGGSGTHTTTTTVSGTRQVAIPVPPNYFAVYQDGAMREKNYGQYYYDNGACAITKSQYITTKIVVPGIAAQSAVNTTGTPPWDQASSKN